MLLNDVEIDMSILGKFLNIYSKYIFKKKTSNAMLGTCQSKMEETYLALLITGCSSVQDDHVPVHRTQRMESDERV